MLELKLQELMQIKISVIVPVFNGAKYVLSCVECLQKQTLKEVEFIFVNDGSTDDTLQILNSLDDSRIRVFSQENKGVSAARNFGMKHALGQYIGFLDADDLHHETMYEVLWTEAQKSKTNIVASNIFLERDGKFIMKEAHFQRDSAYTSEEIQHEIIPYLLTIEDPTLLAVSNKIFERNFLENNKIIFNEKLHLEEDSLFNLATLFYCNSIRFLNFYGYYYRDNPESVTRNFISNDILGKTLEKYHLNYKIFLPLNIPDDEMLRFRSSRLFYSICILLFKSGTNRFISLGDKQKFSKSIIKNTTINAASKQLHINYVRKMGTFEKWVCKSIHLQSLYLIYLTTFSLHFFYRPKLSELLRKLNK